MKISGLHLQWRLLLLLILCSGLAGLAKPGTVHAADAAWTLDQISTGLQSADRPVITYFQPGDLDMPVPDDAHITYIHAAYSYDSTALISSRLCWGSEQGPCITLHGNQLNTHALDGYPARGPLLLIHQLLHWSTGTAPLFVRSNVTVWYSRPQP